MKRTTVIKLAVVSTIIFGGWALNEYASSFMRLKMTVFVNSVEKVDGAECHWTGGQYFDVTVGGVRSRCAVLVFKTSVQSMSAAIVGDDDENIQVASIKLRLIHTDSSGKYRGIQMAPEWGNPPRIGQLEGGRGWTWYQNFRIDEDLTKFSKGSLSLEWSMDKEEADGEIKSIFIVVPLRSENIIIHTSIVGLDQVPTPGTQCASTSRRIVANAIFVQGKT